jgi:hypothetical protein
MASDSGSARFSAPCPFAFTVDWPTLALSPGAGGRVWGGLGAQRFSVYLPMT